MKASPRAVFPGNRNFNATKRTRGCSPFFVFLIAVAVGTVAFSLGYSVGQTDVYCHCATNHQSANNDDHDAEENGNSNHNAGYEEDGSSNQSNSLVFPESLQDLFAGAGRVNRNDFVQSYDVGVPLDPSTDGNNDVLLLYSSPGSLPPKTAAMAASSTSSSIPLYDSVQEATKNCDTLKLILTEPNKHRECLAIQGQWESYHVHKWMRLPIPRKDSYDAKKVEVEPLDDEAPLRYVSRGHNSKGLFTGMPQPYQQDEMFQTLTEYLTKLKDTRTRLEPVLEKAVAGDSQKNRKVVVVLTCNFGQSELLVNFCCNSRAKGLDISKVVVFATDKHTVELATELGLNVFDVQDAFGPIPEQAANHYGDRIFGGMMMAKAYCVHLVNSLGYDLLFQDVDVVWNKNPLDYFYDPALAGSTEFDIYFQDDGAHSPRYAPYSPNTGFYFVRANPRTQFLFSVLVRMGDIIKKTGSHQSSLTALMAEHASWHGLRVKTFGRDADDGHLFPGGFHYHLRKDFIREMIAGTKTPYIFHMSWTQNHKNKKKFFQQMGEWFVEEKCASKKVGEVDGSYGEQCCSAVDPILVCHYRDKPSKIPCKESPPLDKGKRSFW